MSDQIVTLVTSIFQAGGVIAFLFFVIRGLKREIRSLKETITIQEKTLERVSETTSQMFEMQNKVVDTMERRVSATEEVGNVYKQLFDDFPQHLEQYQTTILKLKNYAISELEKANKKQDEKLKNMAEIDLEEIKIKERVLNELPKLREEVSETLILFQKALQKMDFETQPIQTTRFVSESEEREVGLGLRVKELSTEFFNLPISTIVSALPIPSHIYTLGQEEENDKTSK